MSRILFDEETERIQKAIRPQLHPHALLVAIHYSCISKSTEPFQSASLEHPSFFEKLPSGLKNIIGSMTRSFSNTLPLSDTLYKQTIKTIGYSCSGKVLAVGEKVTRFRPGDFVACAGSELGTYADIICVPEQLAISIEETFLKETSTTAIASVALHALHRARVGLGETICIVGLGLIGQFLVQLAKLAGCRVIAIDVQEERVVLAKKVGADYAFLSSHPSLEDDIIRLSSHEGVDCTLITASSKSSDIVQFAMNITRKKGSVVVVGNVGLHLEHDPFCKKEIDLLTSYLFGPGTQDSTYEYEGKDYPFSYVRWTERRNMEAIVRLIQEKKLLTEPLLPEEFSIHNIKKAYENIKLKSLLGTFINCTSLNTELLYKPARREFSPLPTQKFVPAVHHDLRLGLLNVSSLTKKKIQSLIQGYSQATVHAVADYNIGQATKVAHFLGAKKTYLDETELLTAPDINAIIVGPAYRTPATFIMQALMQGKGVFVESPLATSQKTYQPLKQFLGRQNQPPLCANYYKSCAPFIQKIKWEVVERSSPLIMHYRINSAPTTEEGTFNNRPGFGKIIEEASLIFDIFCFLTNSKPVSLSVEALKPNTDKQFPTDNFCVAISFQDGSVGSLIYTSLGHEESDSERFELFYDQKSIFMQDYKTLKGYGTSKLFDETTTIADKGQETLMAQFFKSLKREHPIMPIALDRLTMVTELTLLTDKLVCEGGGSYEWNI